MNGKAPRLLEGDRALRVSSSGDRGADGCLWPYGQAAAAAMAARDLGQVCPAEGQVVERALVNSSKLAQRPSVADLLASPLPDPAYKFDGHAIDLHAGLLRLRSARAGLLREAPRQRHYGAAQADDAAAC
jgi:hypothetical protein